MFLGSSDVASQCPFVIQAEQALSTLKQHMTAHIARESQFRRMYGEWQENWLSRAEVLRQQMGELEARLAPWMPREDGLRLAVHSRTEDVA